MSSDQLPVTMCWHCDRPLDAASSIEDREDRQPHPGAISLCLYCGAVAEFGEDLELRPPTKEALDELVKSSEFMQQFMRFSWARQYVMLQQSLLRDRADPDR